MIHVSTYWLYIYILYIATELEWDWLRLERSFSHGIKSGTRFLDTDMTTGYESMMLTDCTWLGSQTLSMIVLKLPDYKLWVLYTYPIRRILNFGCESVKYILLFLETKTTFVAKQPKSTLLSLNLGDKRLSLCHHHKCQNEYECHIVWRR